MIAVRAGSAPCWLVLLAGVAACGCSRTPEPTEHGAISEPAAPEASAAPAPPVANLTFTRDVVELRVPADWQELPASTDKRREQFLAALNTPKEQPDVLVLVMRPTAVDDSKDGPETLARIAVGSLEARVTPGKLGDLDAVVASAETARSDGKALSSTAWVAVRAGVAFVVSCGGTGAEGIALAARLCGPIVQSYRLVRHVPQVRRIDVPAAAELVTRTIGSVDVRVPRSWEPLGSGWTVAPEVGGFRTPVPKTGPYESATVKVAVIPSATSAGALADEIDRSPLGHTSSRAPFTGPLGASLVSDRRFAGGEASRVYDQVVDGTGYELSCSFPERLAGFSAECDAMARSMRIRR